MATTQRVEAVGVLALVLGVMTFAGMASTGLVSFQPPIALAGSLDRIGEVLPWARLVLAIVLAGSAYLSNLEQDE